MRFQYLDIPNVFKNTEIGIEFIKLCPAYTNLKSVQIILDY